jgi:tRNA-splicing ligase RtcB
MTIAMTLDQGRVPVKVWTDDIEKTALQQLRNMAGLPVVHGHIAVMPDVHAGIGATIGSVIPTRSAIIPSAVGVDIGCGMNAVRLTLRAGDLPVSLQGLRLGLEAAVPVGFNHHDPRHAMGHAHPREARALEPRLAKIAAAHPALAKMQHRFEETWICQLGTLGGGNHFIELCLDEEGHVWVMLHSGSRGIGNAMGRYFIEAARNEALRQQVNLPDQSLAWFSEGEALFDDYIEAVGWAQDYALANRREMMRTILEVLKRELPPSIVPWEVGGEAINCHHNYVAREEHFGESLFVTRKGAISARAGQLGIIPGSMGAKSFIVRGLGNPESMCSCAHGAGRRMSRKAAYRQFNIGDLEAQTAGVECRKDSAVIDEIPGAYKDIDEVMARQRDLVEVVHTLKQVLCVKG